MRDILCLTRPAPASEEQSKLWKNLLEGTLKPAYTWETELSAKGNNKETWEQLIDSGKVGYMALLRNLRNILNSDASNIWKVLDKIADPVSVRQSRQLPFRFLSAYRNIPYNTSFEKWSQEDVREALEKAVDTSIENLPKIPGKTVIAIDVSGSMCDTISAKSDIRCSDIAMMLGIIADRICERAIVYTFDDTLKQMIIPHRNGVLETVTRHSCRGGGTDMYLPIEHMLNANVNADRVIYLSDNMCNHTFDAKDHGWNWYSNRHNGTVQDAVNLYRQRINPDLWVHAVDLQGYGTQQFLGKNTNIIAGWSEKIFEFILLAEKGEGALKQKILEYQI